MKKEYTPEETAKFLAERNAKREAERGGKKHRETGQVLVHSHKPFRGSIRTQFTGPCRNGNVG